MRGTRSKVSKKIVPLLEYIIYCPKTRLKNENQAYRIRDSPQKLKNALPIRVMFSIRDNPQKLKNAIPPNKIESAFPSKKKSKIESACEIKARYG